LKGTLMIYVIFVVGSFRIFVSAFTFKLERHTVCWTSFIF